MDWIVITGVPPWDGRYPFDIADHEPTTREWGIIKRFSGYLPTTIEDGLKGADPELICAFATIALRRAGKIGNDDVAGLYDRLAVAPFGAAVQLETDSVEEADADSPPAGSSNGSSNFSGTDSTASSETSPATPPISGTPGSAGSESPPTVSVISPPRS